MADQPAGRAIQLDAIEIDEAITGIFTEGITRVLETFGIDSTRYEPEIQLLLAWFLWKHSIGRTTTPGTSVSGVGTFGQTDVGVLFRRVSPWQKLGLLGTGALIPWVFARTPDILAKVLQRPQNLFFRPLTLILALWRLAEVVFFLRFLTRSGPPNLAPAILGLEPVLENKSQLAHMDTEFRNREVLWQGFGSVILYFWPLLSNYRLRLLRTLRKSASGKKYLIPRSDEIEDAKSKIPRFFSLAGQAGSSGRGGGIEEVMRRDQKCAVCEQPVIWPCAGLGCDHFVCYFCLESASDDGSGDKNVCPACGVQSDFHFGLVVSTRPS